MCPSTQDASHWRNTLSWWYFDNSHISYTRSYTQASFFSQVNLFSVCNVTNLSVYLSMPLHVSHLPLKQQKSCVVWLRHSCCSLLQIWIVCGLSYCRLKMIDLQITHTDFRLRHSSINNCRPHISHIPHISYIFPVLYKNLNSLKVVLVILSS